MNTNAACKRRREQVLALAAMGQTHAEIAERLNIHEGHVDNILYAARPVAGRKLSLLERCGLTRERVTNYFGGVS